MRRELVRQFQAQPSYLFKFGTELERQVGTTLGMGWVVRARERIGGGQGVRQGERQHRGQRRAQRAGRVRR